MERSFPHLVSTFSRCSSVCLLFSCNLLWCLIISIRKIHSTHSISFVRSKFLCRHQVHCVIWYCFLLRPFHYRCAHRCTYHLPLSACAYDLSWWRRHLPEVVRWEDALSFVDCFFSSPLSSVFVLSFPFGCVLIPTLFPSDWRVMEKAKFICINVSLFFFSQWSCFQWLLPEYWMHLIFRYLAVVMIFRVMAIPATVLYFSVYDALLLWLRSSYGPDSLYIPMLAGSAARTISTTVVSPLEMVRTKMQSERLTYCG